MRIVLSLLLVALSSCDCGLEPLAPVAGRVAGLVCAEDTGLPVAGATLQLLSDDAGEQLGRAETDAGGNFLIDDVPAGPATLIVGGERERSLAVLVDSDNTTSISDPACRDVPPGPGFGDIIGVICNRHIGGLVTDATVTVLLPDGTTQETTTDDQGRFQLFNVPTGPRVVIVSGEGFQRSWAVDVPDGSTVAIPSDGDCRAPSADEGMLAGVFCDPAAQGALAGATVRVTDADERVSQELTDSDGSFLLGPLPPGPALVHVERGEAFTFDVTVVIVAGEQAEVTNGGSCVQEQCGSVAIVSESDGRMELLLVVDRSGSMAFGAPGYPGSRWEGMVDALTGVTAELQARVAFGLALFPPTGTSDDPTAGDAEVCGAAVVDLEPAFDNAAAVETLLLGFDSEPFGATPTAAALAAVADWHVSHPTALPRAVLLATDGGPNCNAALDPFTCRCSSGDDSCASFLEPTLCLDDAAAVASVRALQVLGLQTYVIGIPGAEDFGDVLDVMAETGDTERYYLARDSVTLQRAVADIGRVAGGCAITVGADLADLAAAARLTVTIDGADIARDPLREEGFELVDAHRLDLYGGACEAWLAAGALSLTTCTLDGSTP